MKGNAIRILAGLLALLLLAAAISGCAPEKEEPSVQEKTVLVGYVGDFSGPCAEASGKLWTCATEFFKWANETNYLPGIKVEWIEEDDRYDPGQTPLAYRQIMTEDPMVLFTMTSFSCSIVKPLAGRDRIPVIGFAGSVATAKEPVGYTFLGSLVPEIEFNCFLNYVKDTWTEDRPCRIASLSWDEDLGTQHIQSGIETAAHLGMDYKAEYAEIAPMGTMDFTTYITRLKELDPDYIYNPMIGPAAGSAVKTAVAMGMDPAKFVYIVGSGGGMYEEMINVCGQENTVGSLLVMADYPYSVKTEDQERIREFMQDTEYGWDARYHLNSLSFYFSCKVLYEGLRLAIEDVGIENLDREALYQGLQKIENFDTGVSLPVTYGPDDRLGCQSVQIYEYHEDGLPYLVTDKIYNWPQRWGEDVY